MPPPPTRFTLKEYINVIKSHCVQALLLSHLGGGTGQKKVTRRKNLIIVLRLLKVVVGMLENNTLREDIHPVRKTLPALD